MKKETGRQLTALATSIFFLLTQAVTPQAAWAAGGNLSSEIKPPAEFQLNLPPDLGTIQNLSLGKGPTLIHIQTAHGNYEAQKKIQAILHYLKDNYGIKTLFLEGSAFKLRPEFLRFFPGRMDLTKEIADGLAKKAVVKGAELFLIEDSEAEAYGIENVEAYRANREAFKSVLGQQEKTEGFIRDMNLQIDRLTGPYLNKDLRAFLKRLEEYEAKRLPFMDWLNYLKAEAKRRLEIDLGDPAYQLDWPILLRIFKLGEFESKIDLKAFVQERTEFLNVIKSPLVGAGLVPALEESGHPQGAPLQTYQEIEHLLSSPVTRHQLPDPETGLLFERMVASLPQDFNYQAYPNVKLFIGHLILQSEVKGDRLIEEMNRLTDEISSKLAKTPEEKKILSLLKDHRLLKRLFALELTPEDYEALLRLHNVGAGLGPALEESGHPQGAPLQPSSIIQRFLELNGSKRVRNVTFSHTEEIDSLFEKALEFYRGVKARDEFMTQNILRRMKETKADKAVVITGGFHTEPFQRFFQAQGFNYALIAPKITSVEGREAYIQAILQNESNVLVRSTMEGSYLADTVVNRVAEGEDPVWTATVTGTEMVTVVGGHGVLNIEGPYASVHFGGVENPVYIVNFTDGIVANGLELKIPVRPAERVEVTKTEKQVWALTGKIESRPLAPRAEVRTSVLELIKALKDSDAGVRYRAAYALGRIGPKAKDAVRALIKALEDSDAHVRENSAWALDRIGPAAVPALIKALKDPDAHVRENSAWALGRIGSEAKDAVPALIKALEDSDAFVRESAASALGRIGPAAVPALIKALKDPDAGLRYRAASALGQIDSEALASFIKEALEKKQFDSARRAAEVLVEILRSPQAVRSELRKQGLDSAAIEKLLAPIPPRAEVRKEKEAEEASRATNQPALVAPPEKAPVEPALTRGPKTPEEGVTPGRAMAVPNQPRIPETTQGAGGVPVINLTLAGPLKEISRATLKRPYSIYTVPLSEVPENIPGFPALAPPLAVIPAIQGAPQPPASQPSAIFAKLPNALPQEYLFLGFIGNPLIQFQLPPESPVRPEALNEAAQALGVANLTFQTVPFAASSVVIPSIEITAPPTQVTVPLTPVVPQTFQGLGISQAVAGRLAEIPQAATPTALLAVVNQGPTGVQRVLSPQLNPAEISNVLKTLAANAPGQIKIEALGFAPVVREAFAAQGIGTVAQLTNISNLEAIHRAVQTVTARLGPEGIEQIQTAPASFGVSLPEGVRAVPLEESLARLRSLGVDIRRPVTSRAEVRTVVPILIKELQNENPNVRKEAAQAALVQIALVGRSEVRNEVVSSLINALETPAFQVNAIEALGRLAQTGVPLEAAVSPLVTLLGATSSRVEEAAQGALVQIGQPALPELVKALETREFRFEIRLGSVQTLGKMGPVASNAILPLVRIVINKEEEASLREEAARALSLITPNSASASGVRVVIPALTKVLNEENLPTLRIAAARALVRFGALAAPAVSALVPLLAGTSSQEVNAGQEALVSIGQPAVHELDIAVGTKEFKPELRLAAVETLERIGPAASSSLPSLVEVLNNKQEKASLQLAAIKALGKISGSRSELRRLGVKPELIEQILGQKTTQPPVETAPPSVPAETTGQAPVPGVGSVAPVAEEAGKTEAPAKGGEATSTAPESNAAVGSKGVTTPAIPAAPSTFRSLGTPQAVNRAELQRALETAFTPANQFVSQELTPRFLRLHLENLFKPLLPEVVPTLEEFLGIHLAYGEGAAEGRVSVGESVTGEEGVRYRATEEAVKSLINEGEKTLSPSELGRVLVRSSQVRDLIQNPEALYNTLKGLYDAGEKIGRVPLAAFEGNQGELSVEIAKALRNGLNGLFPEERAVEVTEILASLGRGELIEFVDKIKIAGYIAVTSGKFGLVVYRSEKDEGLPVEGAVDFVLNRSKVRVNPKDQPVVQPSLIFGSIRAARLTKGLADPEKQYEVLAVPLKDAIFPGAVVNFNGKSFEFESLGGFITSLLAAHRYVAKSA